jgi:hypothetical protein
VRHAPALENLTGAIIEVCRSGVSPDVLREGVLSRLRRAVPFDAAFWSTVDPATLLFTQAHQEEIPPDTTPYFVENEFLVDDVNKWTALARDRAGVRTLVEATGGDIEASSRYREIFRPYVNRVAPHIAEGIRTGPLARHVEDADLAAAPGLLLLAPDGSLISTTEAGEMWLAELGHPDPTRHGLPGEIVTLAARFRHDEPKTPTRLRLRTQAGRWAVLHASRLPSAGTDALPVIIEEPSPAELVPVLMMAYGLTRQEQALTTLVCRGLSTKEIAGRLHITPNTSRTTSSRSSRRPA